VLRSQPWTGAPVRSSCGELSPSSQECCTLSERLRGPGRGHPSSRPRSRPVERGGSVLCGWRRGNRYVMCKELATPAASPRLRGGPIRGRERGCVPGPRMPKPGRSGSWTFPAQARRRPASGPGRRSPIPQSRASAAAGTSPNP
jgi:hypothetical protein